MSTFPLFSLFLLLVGHKFKEALKKHVDSVITEIIKFVTITFYLCSYSIRRHSSLENSFTDLNAATSPYGKFCNYHLIMYTII